LGLVILGVIIYFVIIPGWTGIQSAREKIEVDRALLTRLKAKANNVAEARENYELVEKQTALINEAIPNYSDPALAMKMLEKLATEVVDGGGPLLINDIRVSQMPQDTQETAVTNNKILESNEVVVMVNLSGDYQAVHDYVTQLRSLRHNFYLEKITFSASQDATQQFLDAVINLKYYYFN
jgi:hypothetical protein